MCHCNRLIGIVCDDHCTSDVCRNGEHVDRCVGPTRNRQLELLHRHGVEITDAVADKVLGVERAFREVYA